MSRDQAWQNFPVVTIAVRNDINERDEHINEDRNK